MSKIKALIFDLDGTLLNTLESLANCYNRVLSNHQLTTHSVDAYRHFIGNGAKRCLTACLSASGELADFSDSDLRRLLSEQQVDYRESWHLGVSIYPGIPDLVGELLRRDVLLGVLTNKDQEFAVRCVSHFFPDTDFVVIQGFEEVVPHKPDPTGALTIAQKLNLEPHQLALLGDTSVDIETAHAAGLIGIGALWGFRDREELTTAGASYVIEQPLDLLGLPILSD